MKIDRYERIFIGLSVVMLACMLVAIAMAINTGHELPGAHHGGTVDPEALDTTAPFDDPGLHQTGPATYDAVIVASAWQYNPGEITVPAGSTSKDVIHGLRIIGTNVNVMVIPGYISMLSHTFDEPGEYLVVCHEYCGVGHQNMSGKVIVTAAAADASGAPGAPDQGDGQAADGAADSLAGGGA
jgi:cytochrome c oxidase subunit 2